ncbi:MAG: hypothetical protein IKR44_00395 [Bacteroidales bacterium]|nr:hypothetical protein [Bacteroidales bacterium]
MGTYGYDRDFFASKGIRVLELRSPDGQAKVLVVPAFQGRVMTSTTGGEKGPSFGWINYKAIEEGMVNPQFNPFGGEERFWIGPEGGPFSWYFKPGEEQVYANWNVPAFIDSEPFEVESSSETEAIFTKEQTLRNASGNEFSIGVRRAVRLLDAAAIGDLLGVAVPEGVRSVAYCTANTLVNNGSSAWTKETGMPSVWLLGMYPPTPTTTVFIPYNKDFEGRVVNDEYFGKVPSDRLSVKDGMIYFKIDGEYRAKIGLPAGSAKDICGSYDSKAGVLNILKYTVPEGDNDYVNGQWGPQEDPFSGDVINSYNDGPTETGVVMGPFYEIETSSPGAALAPGASLTHTQYTIHLEGSREDLAGIVKTVFGADLDEIISKF